MDAEQIQFKIYELEEKQNMNASSLTLAMLEVALQLALLREFFIEVQKYIQVQDTRE